MADATSAHRLLRRLGPVAGAPLLAPAVLAALPFWAVAAATRRLARWRVLEPETFSEPVVEYLPVLGARPRPQLQTRAKAEDVFRLTTDNDGWRGTATIDEADVVVFGDSFAFGWGVDDRDHFSELAAPLRVKPVASPAYSMVHTVLWMTRLQSRLAGRTVVWFVYCGNDLVDNIHPNMGTYRMPFVRERGRSWEIVTDHVSPEPWTFRDRPVPNDDRMVELCRPTNLSRRAFAAADHLVGRGAALCQAVGADLALVSVPITSLVRDPERLVPTDGGPPVDTELPDRNLAESCRSHGVDFLALRSRLRPEHYWHDDMHWSPAGHQVAAAAVAELHGAIQRRPQRVLRPAISTRGPAPSDHPSTTARSDGARPVVTASQPRRGSR